MRFLTKSCAIISKSFLLSPRIAIVPRLLHSSSISESTSRNTYTFKMPAFTLYGARGSTNTDRVRLTLAEGGFTDYETVLINLQKGEQKSADNMKRHPWGKIPSIVYPSGFTLHESRAICAYLTRKYNFPLLPSATDIEATALFDQAQSIEMFYFADPAARISFEKIVKQMIGVPTDEKVVADSLAAVEAFFEVIEHVLTKQEYMAGKSFTLADIFYIPLVQRLFACGYGEVITKREAVNKWWKACVSRPAIAEMLATDKKAMEAAFAAAGKTLP